MLFVLHPNFRTKNETAIPRPDLRGLFKRRLRWSQKCLFFSFVAQCSVSLKRELVGSCDKSSPPT
jgi:hypothetical protein